MADMGFLPQVEWILRTSRGPPPDAAVLGHARRRGRRAGAPLPCTIRCCHEVESRHRSPSTRWTHRFLLVHEMDKVKVARRHRAQACRARWCSCAPSAAPTASSSQLKQRRRGRRRPSTATSARRRASGRSTTSRTGSSRCSSPPTSPPAASTSTTSTSSCTTTRRRTTRPTCTARAAPPGPASPASSSRSCCGTRSSRSSGCCRASASKQPIVEVFSNDPAWPIWPRGTRPTPRNAATR